MSVEFVLSEQNPWWKNTEKIDENRYIRRWESSGVKWFPDAYTLKEIPGTIYIIKGPRQVGKSTGIMLKIRELLKSKKIDSKDVVYVHCEAFESRRQLEEAIRFVAGERKVWIFIDEASHIKDWFISVKYLKDINLLDRAIVVITGSSSMDLSKASSYLAGRRGEIYNVQLDRAVLPLSFREFIVHAYKKLEIDWMSDKNRRIEILKRTLSGEIPEELVELKFLWKELMDAFYTYLLTGGFPLPIDEFLKKGEIGRGIYSLYLNLIRRDLQREGYDLSKADQILRKIIEAHTNPIGYIKIKAGTSIASPATVSEYINALTNSFIISQLMFFDPSRKVPIFRKEKKYYIRDTFIFHALRGWLYGIDPFASAKIATKDPMITGLLVEYVVGEHLLRVAAEMNGRSLADPMSTVGLVGYWRSGGREVNFMVKIKDRVLPIELKFQEAIGRRDLRGILTAESLTNSKGIILTKNISHMEEHPSHIKIPVPFFLVLI